jgi:hypothetical protein
MNLKTFFTIKGVITLIFGLLFLLLPVWTWGLYDVKLGMDGAMVARYLGTAFLAIFMVCWFNRESSEEAQKSATLNLAITDTIGFIVSLIAQFSGGVNALGWLNVVLWLLLAAGNIYFQWFAE